jgi:hypothetical protein
VTYTPRASLGLSGYQALITQSKGMSGLKILLLSSARLLVETNLSTRLTAVSRLRRCALAQSARVEDEVGLSRSAAGNRDVWAHAIFWKGAQVKAATHGAGVAVGAPPSVAVAHQN